MTIQVYRGNEPTIELPLEMAAFTEEKQGVHELVFTVDVPSILDIEIGDTITFHNEVMKVNYTPTYTNNGEFSRSYVITFEGHRATLYDQPLVDEGDVEFNYHGDAVDLLNLVLTNINTLDAGWTAGEVETVEPQAFEFDNISCLEALNTIAEKFGLEWKIKQRVITLKKNTGVERAVVLSQGRSNGLYSLTREYLKDSNIVTRAYGLGSTKNLPAEYEGKRLSLPDYIEANTDKYGIKVKYYKFDDVYPRRTGTASAVAKVNDKTFTLTDTGLNFDINGQRAGENDVKIVFKSGSLNGQEFTVSRYDHATKTITYKANEDSNGLLIPFGVTVAEVGDKYTLVGLIMPQIHIDEAKAELVAKRAEALTRDSVPKVVYSLNSDVLFLKDNGLTLEAGDIVKVKDLEIGLDELLTIQRVSYPAIFPQQLVPGMQFVAEVGNTSYEKIQDKIYKDVQEQKTINGQIRRNTAELARVNALRLRELQNYIFDADDYFDADRIKPQSIETQMLAVGAKSQNFYLSGVTMQPNFTSDANKFHVSGGQLQHREISIATGFIWVLNAQTFQALDPSKVYYLSAKCNKTQLIGTYNLTEQPYKVEDQEGFYTFNIGVLYPVGADGKRYFANTSGVSYVVGSQITTGRIKSLDGNTWFDLDTGEIRGAITFTSGQSVQDAIDQAKGEAVAQSGVATQQAIANLSIGGRNYIRNSNEAKAVGAATGITVVNNSDGSFTVNAAAGNGNYLKLNYLISPDYIKDISTGDDIIFSVDVKAESGSVTGRIDVHLNESNSYSRLNGALVLDKWVRMYSVRKYSGAVIPLNLHLGFYGIVGAYSFKNIKFEKGNKSTPWVPAPEDLQQQIVDTDNARKAYIDAQDILKETQTRAYADGKVSAEEARAIADATTKANAAKSYADAQDMLLKTQANAYADGKVTAEEQARINQAQTNLQAAKDYAAAQDNLAKVEAKAYADGIVDAEEARAIADAQAKLNEAKSHADAQASQAQANAITASNTNITTALNGLIIGGRNYIRNSNEAKAGGAATGITPVNNADGSFTVNAAAGNGNYLQLLYPISPDYIKDINTGDDVIFSVDVKVESGSVTGRIDVHLNGSNPYSRLNGALVLDKWVRMYSVRKYSGAVIPLNIHLGFVGIVGVYSFKNIKFEKGNKATPWVPAPEDLQQQIVDTDNARKAYIDAQDNLKETQTRAYADGKVSAEEARAIADATTKANAAKSYADAQDVLLKTQANAYADGKITAEEQRAIADAIAKLNEAKNYTNNQVSPLQSLINELRTKTGIAALPSGKTIVNGGQIDTDLMNAIAVRALIMSVGLLTASEIDVATLFAQYIEASQFNLKGGKIGPLNVTPSALKLGNSDGTNSSSWDLNQTSLFFYASYILFREVGASTSQVRELAWNLYNNVSGAPRTSNLVLKNTMNTYNGSYPYTNVGLEVHASGANHNIAIDVISGKIRNIMTPIFVTPTGGTLNLNREYHTVVLALTSTTNQTLNVNLPSSPEDGKIFVFRQRSFGSGVARIDINGNGAYINSNTSTSISFTTTGSREAQYAASTNTWYID